MSPNTLFLAAAALLTVTSFAGSAYAFSETEIDRFHVMCRAGDHDACARRDAAIHDRDHEGEWRTRHPDWYR